jgi:protein-disulfide isomerase
MKRFELAVPVNAQDHNLGPTHAAVTVVEYGDFECPNCKQAAPAVKMLLERFVGRVRLVWRQFPLEEVHPYALTAALASEVAAGQGKFWPMHDRLFEQSRHLDAAHLRQHAQAIELDMRRYDADTADTVYLQRVREDIEGARASGVRGTPTFFVNGAIHDVSFGLEGLFETVEAALAKERR